MFSCQNPSQISQLPSLFDSLLLLPLPVSSTKSCIMESSDLMLLMPQLLPGQRGELTEVGCETA